jgi:hypothetical protein
MEEAAELGNYLPLSFKTPSEQEYIAFLWDAFETNYTHGKYQFAFLAYHMLSMSFVNFNIWQIRQARPEDFGKGLIGFGKDIEKNLLGATSPFVFSTVKERRILRVVDEIQTHSTPVIEHCYREFLLQNHDPEERAYPDAVDQIREVLIHENYLSQEDINICLGFDLDNLADRPDSDSIRTLHEVLRSEYGPDDEHRAS